MTASSHSDGDRHHLSIGEVLGLLVAEFPDVTISKIRFLEAQGLIDPERTPSGYRKFYDTDVARLRWVLTQQRDHFLPIKVIRERLAEGAADLAPADAAVPATLGPPPAAAPAGAHPAPAEALPAATPPDAVLAGEPADPAEPAEPAEPARRAAGRRLGNGVRPQPPRGPVAAVDPEPPPAPDDTPPPPLSSPRRPAPPFPASLRRTDADAPAAGEPTRPARTQGRSSPAAFLTAPADRVARPPDVPERPTRPSFAPVPEVDLEALDADELTAEELAKATGLPLSEIGDLERFGLVNGVNGPGGRYYDTGDLAIARLAAGLARFGVGARHLRLWKSAADREADLFETVVAPLRRQRNPASRREAEETVAELARLGDDLHAALVASALLRSRTRR